MWFPRTATIPALAILACGMFPRTHAASRAREEESPEKSLLGLFVPQEGPGKTLGQSIRLGVELALQMHRERSIDRMQVRLQVRPCDGLWGRGSLHLTQLAYADRAVAIIGAPDRATAHLAAQIAAKAHLPVITPWAASDSITLTGVPWVLRTVPNEGEQAKTMAREILEKRNLQRIALVFTPSHQHRLLAVTAKEAFAKEGLTVLLLKFRKQSEADQELVLRIREQKVQGFLLCAGAREGAELLSKLRRRGLELPGFGLLELSSPEFTSGLHGPAGDFSVLDLEELDRRFADAFRGRFGRAPDAAAALSFDAAQAVFRALASAGPDRSAIRSFLLADRFPGASGLVEFDRYGQRVRGTVRLKARRLGLPPAR